MRAVLLALLVTVGCQKANTNDNKDVAAAAAKPAKRKTPQVEAPFDVKNPPADAVHTPSGLVYKTIVANPAGQAPRRNDTVMIKYTGWRQESGETFFSNKSADEPMPLNLATTARGFTEAMQLVKKGEKAMLWLPPEIGLKDGQGDKKGETLVYEVEVVDIKEAPALPPDVAAPPADAIATKKQGVKYEIVRAGTGKDRVRYFDRVTFNYTAWNVEGRMIETTEMKKRPVESTPPYKQSAALEDVLTQMTAGERVRFWVDAQQMRPNIPVTATGPLCYEVEVLQIDKAVAVPPATPADVAKPPGDAKKTAKGVFYKVLKSGKGGAKPNVTDSVRVNYTGWTTDGRMFDSSIPGGEPSEFKLTGVIAGWTDGIPLMSVGDTFRFWIPDTLAYKGQLGRPQGMLVFDVELLEVKAAPAHHDNPHGHP